METTWRPVLIAETEKPYWKPLQQFVKDERKKYTVFPPDKDVFAALHLTPYEKVSVLILGQDPYHEVGQAHGLCFSVRSDVAIPPSLQNIYQELHDDLGCRIPNNGCLTPWAEQGVLLNAVLCARTRPIHQGRG
jgi:uracil-DNA glycosylase